MADSRSVLKSVRRNERSCAFWGIGVPPPPAGLTVKFDKAGNVSQRSPGLPEIPPTSANSPASFDDVHICTEIHGTQLRS